MGGREHARPDRLQPGGAWRLGEVLRAAGPEPADARDVTSTRVRRVRHCDVAEPQERGYIVARVTFHALINHSSSHDSRGAPTAAAKLAGHRGGRGCARGALLRA